MQSLSWYANRLRSMSAGEIGWRVRAKLHDAIDKCLAARRRRPLTRNQYLAPRHRPDQLAHGVIGEHFREESPRADGSATAMTLPIADWQTALRQHADRIAAHRLDMFDLRDIDLGTPIRWNHEYKSGTDAPLGYAPAIDYRDYQTTGDCKFVWELNRHHQLVVLGRAYRATGEIQYARAVADMLDDWLTQCPYGLGMNWRSPLELSIRMINWVWALDLIRPAGVVGGELQDRLLASAYRHIREIAGKYSQYSSANNHLVGEAAGVFIAATYFANLRDSHNNRDEARHILEREILRQNYADGGNKEQATGYHLFVLQFFLFSALVARRRDHNFSDAYEHRLEAMFDFLAGLIEGGEHLPMFGDADDGYVLDLGGRDHAVRAYLGVGAVLFDRPDWKAAAGALPSEPIWWLFGQPGMETYESLDTGSVDKQLTSHAFEETGYYLLQHGERGADDAISLVFDAGALGFESIAAHGHADALSFVLRVGGEDVLVDPGTYDYFTYDAWRNYFRSTAAHNTIEIDGQSQSDMLGRFLWGVKARTKRHEWAPNPGGGRISASHDGYTRLRDGVQHRRSVTLLGEEQRIIVEDHIQTEGKHHLRQHWHFAETASVAGDRGNLYIATFDRGHLTIALDARLTVRAVHGQDNPTAGWVSRGYHRKLPTTSLTGECQIGDTITLRTEIRLTTVMPDKRDGSAAGARRSEPEAASNAARHPQAVAQTSTGSRVWGDEES